jgi:symplekin
VRCGALMGGWTQVWRFARLWEGFVKCAQQLAPDSYQLLLQLPVPQLEDALRRCEALRAPLATYASAPHVKATMARAALVALGVLAPEPAAAAAASGDDGATAEVSAVEAPGEAKGDQGGERREGAAGDDVGRE